MLSLQPATTVNNFLLGWRSKTLAAHGPRLKIDLHMTLLEARSRCTKSVYLVTEPRTIALYRTLLT
jgi:hypothetical protein